MAKEYKDLMVGLDIGTSKVMAVVAEITGEGELKLAGLGIAPGNASNAGQWSTSTPRCRASSRPSRRPS